MALLEEDHAFEIADAVLAASEADETEVAIHCVEDRFVRFGHEGPTQSADRERYDLAVRVRFRDGGGFREAKASSGSLDEASVLDALGRAEILARVASPDPGAVPLDGAVEVEGTAPSRPTQDHSFKEKAEWIEAALRRCESEGLHGGGLARTTVASRSLINSAGRRVHGATSRAEFALTCADGGADAETVGGSASSASVRCFVDQVDVEGVIEDAVTSAVRARDPEDVEASPMDVLLEPQAVAALMTFTSGMGFGARGFHEGSSFLTGRVGERLFAEGISISDDPTHPDLRGLRFDGEGTPRGAHALVSSGTAHGPVTDASWAHQLGLPNTGHSQAQPSTDGPSAGHLVVAEGDLSREELLERLGDGLLVRQLHYVNVVEPRELVLTGMTRGGVFRVKDGVVGGAIGNLRFTQSLVEALGAVDGVGDRATRVGSLMGGELVAPSLLIRGFQFTSKARS